MSGLFGTLDLSSRALQTQRQGVETAGHNIANVNTPGYTRQRLQIETSPAILTSFGAQGTGANAAAIVQLRSRLLDQQLQGETSVGSYLEAQQNGLQNAQGSLGQVIDSSTGSASSLGHSLSDLFSAFQTLSSAPASQPDRQVLLLKAADLASRFNQTDQRLGGLHAQLDHSLQSEVTSANDLLSQIAGLNDRILRAQAGSGGAANDLMDLRGQKIEALAKLTNMTATPDANGAVNVSIGGTTLVSGKQLLDTLQTYDAGGGQMLVRTAASGAPLTLTGGSLAGTIDVRDGELASLRRNINSLASQLMAQVNTVHRDGFNLNGGTGADFFSGTNAADIQVNSALLNNPALLQAGGVAGVAGDNQVALALAQLADQPLAALNNQTFSQSYSQTVAALGQSLASLNARVEDQQSVQTLLSRQRDSLSGVSLDEEMIDLMKYQKAFQASAHMVSVVGEMLDTVLNMK